jgi:RimJ/RimL family protein N-acetyltransferase
VHEIIAASAAGYRERGAGVFLAALRDGGGVAGLAGFRPAEIGGLELVCALWPRRWGKGLAVEACRACLAYAFETVGLDEVLAAADAPNDASLHLIERLGFEPLRETPGAFGVIRWLVVRRPTPRE